MIRWVTWHDIWRRQEEERSAKFKELSEYQPIGRMGQPKEVWLLPKGLMLRYNAPCPVLPVPVFRLARPGVPPYKASGLPGLVLRLLGLRVPSYKAGWMQVASLILYLCSDEASFVTGGTKLLVAHLPI